MTEGSRKNSKNQPASRRECLPFHSFPIDVQHQLDFIFNHLYLLSKSWVAAYDMRPFNVTLRERLALELLYVTGGLPQHVVGANLDVNPNVMVVLVDKLEKQSLVERNIDMNNRRRRIVRLTERGRDQVRRMLEVIDVKTEDVLAALPAGAFRAFMQLVDVLIAEMDKRLLSPNLTGACKRSAKVANA